MSTQTLHGIIQGDNIQLAESPNLPAGTPVKVVITPELSSPHAEQPLGEGLRKSAGAWAADGEELDRFIEWTYEQRRNERREIQP